MAGEIKIPLPSFRKKMGRKRPFRFHSCAPFLPHPKTFSMEASAVLELSGWQLSSSARLVLLQQTHLSVTFQAQKTRSSGNSVATDGNAACGFHTLAVWTTQQVAAFRPNPKRLQRTEVGLARPTTPPVSHLPKELQSEAAFFSQ